MNSTRRDVQEVLMDDDTLEDLVCRCCVDPDAWDKYQMRMFYSDPIEDEFYSGMRWVKGNELPDVEYKNSWGDGCQGPNWPVMCWSRNWIYVRYNYDGVSRIVPIARHPENVALYDAFPDLGE